MIAVATIVVAAAVGVAAVTSAAATTMRTSWGGDGKGRMEDGGEGGGVLGPSPKRMGYVCGESGEDARGGGKGEGPQIFLE